MNENKIKISQREAEVLIQLLLRYCGNCKYVYNATPEELERAIHILHNIIDIVENEFKQKET